MDPTLLAAVQFGNLEAAILLIQHGADVTLQVGCIYYLLIYALLCTRCINRLNTGRRTTYAWR